MGGHDLEDVPPAADLRVWCFSGRRWELGRSPRLMGIVNVTPDSFSDGGESLALEAAVARALALVEEGADIIDIGGESTRPGATPVTADEERRRVLPVVQRLAEQTDVPISIDTTKATIAAEALRAGATIVNDISGLTFDSDMPRVCADSDAGVVCMHIRGTPQTMQDDPRYDDVVEEIVAVLAERLGSLEAAGIARERVVVDPGIGFGKTAEHNLTILANIARLRSLGRPVLVGHSRKRFLGRVLGRAVDERLAGTVGIAVALARQSCDILRVHDVRATRDALLAVDAILGRLKQHD